MGKIVDLEICCNGNCVKIKEIDKDELIKYLESNHVWLLVKNEKDKEYIFKKDNIDYLVIKEKGGKNE